MYSPIHCQASAPVINIQPPLHTTPDLCKNISLTISFGSNSNSYTTSTQSVHKHIFSSQHGQALFYAWDTFLESVVQINITQTEHKIST